MGTVAIGGPEGLRLYSMVDHGLMLKHRVPCSVARLEEEGVQCSPLIPHQVLSFSPSGSHVLAMLQEGLAIVSTASGVKRAWQEHMKNNDTVCWASDATVAWKRLPTLVDEEGMCDDEPDVEAMDAVYVQPAIEVSFMCFA